MSRPVDVIAEAIRAADNSYFNEDYTKQARAVLAALEKQGFALMPRSYPEETWKAVADAMKTGRIRPEDHVKNVFETVLRLTAAKA